MQTNKDITEIIQNNMMDYSASVLTDRAFPAIQDGFKPVTRRIMFTMQNKKIDKLTKSMNVTGLVSAVHPHGTTYETIVGMVQKDNWQVPLIDGHGNFSLYSSRDLQAGADRYTEIKISDFGKEMTSLIPNNVVKNIPNYDGTIQMPIVIPVKFPLILIQSQSGLGVGYSSSTLSYNMREIVDSIEQFIRIGKSKPLYPDFPTKGFILTNKEELENGMVGKSSFTLEGKIESVDKQTIRITEFPYGVKYENVIDKIISLVKDGQLPGVVDVKDLNDFNGINVEIYTRKNANHEDLIKKILKKTPLSSKINSNPNMIDINNGTPKIYGTNEVIKIWLNWRKDVVIEQTNQEINKISNKLYYLNGLEKILIDVDKAVDIIRHSKNTELLSKLQNVFDLEEKQARYIVNMKLYNINENYIQEKLKEIENLKNKVAELKRFVENDQQILESILRELKDIAEKYGVDRQTIIKEVLL